MNNNLKTNEHPINLCHFSFAISSILAEKKQNVIYDGHSPHYLDKEKLLQHFFFLVGFLGGLPVVFSRDCGNHQGRCQHIRAESDNNLILSV